MVVHVVQHTTQFHEPFILFAIVRISKYNLLKMSSIFLSLQCSYMGLHCQEKQECLSTSDGSNCSIQCSAPNSCSQGHYYCNSKGEKACLSGWGPINRCTQKLIAPVFDSECPISTGCLNGGSCFNDSCCCPATYTGR